jgi:uncharacterized protein (TIGR02145 family)/prepilin-type N-terminal cleavage/methylation domain-containing protein
VASPAPARTVIQTGGFTIVELLVVIVVIGILAALTIVAYTGISGKANIASLQSDLSNAKKQLALYNVEHSVFPTSLTAVGNKYCPTGDDNYCFKASTGNTFTYTSISPYSTFSLTNTNTNSNTIYTVTNDSGPTVIPTVTIGSQTWMQYNLDVGTRIDGAIPQSSNSILEKWCYNNDPANCTTYGGLYQWGETVQYQDGASNTTSPSTPFSGNVQGIAPAGFHIPTDTEYKTLESSLGMVQAQYDAVGWRGTTEGDKLKSAGLCQGRTPCGTSGFNVLPGGTNNGSSFGNVGTHGLFWFSTQSSASMAWRRYLLLSYSQTGRDGDGANKISGFSVRALKN